MSVIAVLGTKHSPGATTLAMALSALIAGANRPLLVEADPAGGDLAIRSGLPLDPGLLTLAAAGRRGLSLELVEAHSQTMANGARVLLAPASPEHAHPTVAGLAAPLAALLSSRPGITIVDAGRWDGRSPTAELVRAADVVLALFRPTVGGVEHLRALLASLDGIGEIVPVVVGERPYRLNEVSDALDGLELRLIDNDPRGATSISRGAPIDRWLRRTALVRSISPLIDHLSSVGSSQAVAP